MDRLDEWMKRAFGTPSNKASQPQQKPFSNKEKNLERKHFNNSNKRKPFRKQQQNTMQKQVQVQQQRPTQQRPAQQPQHHAPKPAVKPVKKLPSGAKKPPSQILRGKLKIIPLGGLNEVGKNMMIFEYEEDIIIVDMGFEFPGEDMLGIDYVIPDVSYLEENKKRIRGVIITHGHLDHIGGIPYILPKLDFPPLYGTKLTMGLARKRVEEFNQERTAQLRVIDPDKPLKLGKFTINFFRVVHSIPDAVGVVIETPIGKIVHTGDFKFDETPATVGQKADINKIKALGSQNVLALFSDSTNALKPGRTMSEKQVGETLEEVIKKTEGRLIIASFSSLIGRIQQIIDLAQKHNRQIFVSGRSMKENIDIAFKLGYLKFKPGTVKDIKRYKDIPDKEVLILTTGSQGEAVSALTRISNNEHPHIKVKKGDTIVLSASPIIGNERAIFTVVNNLCILGARVIHNEIMDVHTSGHGRQEDLKMMIDYVRPKFFLPIHGEYFMRQSHAELANEKCGIPKENITMLQNGDVLLAERGRVYKSNQTVETKYILIDGLGEGHVGSQVQMDREIMSQNGALMVLIYVNRKNKKPTRDPDIISRGFIYMHESDEITAEIIRIAREAYKNIITKNPGANRQDIKKYIRQTIDKYTHNKLERRPLIVPLIVET